MFAGISPENITLYGTNVPPFLDPEIPIDQKNPAKYFYILLGNTNENGFSVDFHQKKEIATR